MDPFLLLLRGTVAKLPVDSPMARQAAYERARMAVHRQLSDTTPPPTDDECKRMISRVEAAIAEVEREFGSGGVIGRI